MDKPPSSFGINERAASLLSYAIVCVMMVCAIFIAVRFGQALIPAWQGSYMVLLGFLVVLEAFLTQHIRKKLIVLDQEWFMFYLAEFVVLLLFLKAFQLLGGGMVALHLQIAALQQDFANNFFNTEYLFSLLALVIIWLVSLSFSGPLEVLRVSQQNLMIEEDVGSYAERSAARQSLVDQVLLVGLVMVVMSSLMRSDRTTGWFQLPGTRLDVVIIMVYFGLGLILLSLTQYFVMQMRWAVNRIPTSHRLAWNWVLYGFLFMVFVSSVSLLLPTSYTIGLLTLLNVIVGLVLAVVQLLGWLVLALFMLVTYFLGFLSSEPQEREPLPPAPLPTPLPLAERGAYNIDILEWIGSILFWGVMAVLMAYLLIYFYRVRRQDMVRVARLPVLSTLNALIRALRDWIKGLRSQVSQTVKAGVERLRMAPVVSLPRPSWGYTSLRRMKPRQRVIFYYLAMVRRGGECGALRGKSQTPYEYAARLSGMLRKDPAWDGEIVQADLEDITERFLEARYSRHAVDNEQVSRVRQSWQRLKNALRSLKTATYDR
jgi:hypothetical protein